MKPLCHNRAPSLRNSLAAGTIASILGSMETEPLLHENWPRACVAYREREPGRVQLRVDLMSGEGVCDVEVEEDDEQVAVFVLICGERDDDATDVMNVPVHIYLDEPLGNRPVRDLVSGRLLPLHVPNW